MCGLEKWPKIVLSVTVFSSAHFLRKLCGYDGTHFGRSVLLFIELMIGLFYDFVIPLLKEAPLFVLKNIISVCEKIFFSQWVSVAIDNNEWSNRGKVNFGSNNILQGFLSYQLNFQSFINIFFHIKKIFKKKTQSTIKISKIMFCTRKSWIKLSLSEKKVLLF